LKVKIQMLFIEKFPVLLLKQGIKQERGKKPAENT